MGQSYWKKIFEKLQKKSINLVKKKIKICVISGSRADYGIMSNMLYKLQSSKKFDLKLIVTCMHLIPRYGNTYKEILKDNIKIFRKIKLPLKDDKISSISKATGMAIIKFTKLLLQLKPNLVLILGDRFESLAFAIAALYSKIHIVHIHGGESTLSQIDDAIRHSITKISNLHLVTNKIYKNRLINMGEDKKNVHIVGSLGVENLKKIKFYKKKEIEKKINFYLNKKLYLITIHPETLGNQSDMNKFIDDLLNYFVKIKNIKFIFTAPNVDMGNLEIYKRIKNFTLLNSHNSIFVKSLGQKLYFSLAKLSEVIIGNSSSGIIEIPSLNIPTINLGDRQKGRLMAGNIINSKIDIKNFKVSLKKALSVSFKKKIRNNRNLYDKKNTSDKIIKILNNYNFKKSTMKAFIDN